MERSIPLNLDLTCMKVETKLEDSLAIASTALNLVKSVEPSIITIQCLIAEESLDYLLFKKLPGNHFCKKFTKSTDINRQPNSCVAWKTSLYRATLVNLSPIAQLFPQTNVDSSTMVHLWPKVSGAVALTIISWTGLYNHFNNKERTVFFETFLKFLGAFRQLNNFKMRILVGGLYNVDLKVTQFWRFPELVPLVYTNRPNPNERRELQCSFIYTKDTLKMMDHTVQKIGDKSQDHWAISASIAALASEKGELSPYNEANVRKMEEALHARSSDTTVRPQCLSIQDDFCLIRDSSSTASDSGAFSGTTESIGNESSRESFKSPLLNNRREQKAYITHLDRHSAKDRATLPTPMPHSSPKKSPKISRALANGQSKDPAYEDDQPGGGQMNPGLLALLKWESDCERECPLEWQQPPCSPPCSPIHLQDKNRLSLQRSNPKSPRRDSACETGAASPRGNLTALTSHAFQIVRSPSSMSNTGGAISFCMDNSLKKSRVRGMDVCALMNDTSE